MSNSLKIENIDHSDIGGFLQTQPFISGDLYKALTDFGHKEKDLRAVIKSTGTQMDQAVRNQIRRVPMGVYHRSTLNQYDQGNPTGGRGNHHGITSVQTAQKMMPSAFDSDGFLKPGYSFTPGEGKSVVATSMYPGNDTSDGGMVTIYGPGGGAAQTQNVETTREEEPAPRTTGDPDPIQTVTGEPVESVGEESSGPNFQDLIDAIANMSAPVINIPPPPVFQPPPPPASYAAVGQAASANPGVRIRRSRSRAQGTNTLGTNFFNRGTRNTLRISGINV